MPTISLPERPNLEQLRNQARELQRAVRSGEHRALRQVGLHDPVLDYPLSSAQLFIARRYGFASWARLRQHVDAITARTWTFADPAGETSPADRFVRLACVNYSNDNARRTSDAATLLARHPELPSTSLAVAAAVADNRLLARHLDLFAGSAIQPTGPYGWSPIMYAAYSRLEVDRDAAVSTMRVLLEAGADPNDGRFFAGLPTPFTVLTGVFGGGEDNPPPHPHSLTLARLLLSAGAEANDGQTLYNRMFGTDDDFLEILFEFGLGQGDGGPWRRLLPDLLDSPTELLQALLNWAVTHDQRERVALLAANGVDVLGPLGGGATPVQVAGRNGHRELAEQLVSLGAHAPAFDPVEEFIAAALAGDAGAARATPRAVVNAARRARPALVVWAAGLQRLDAVELLVALGFDVNAFGRSDVPVEQKWQTPLHAAVEHGDAPLVQRLLELGADKSLRDRRFDATPSDWAAHVQRRDLAQLLDNWGADDAR